MPPNLKIFSPNTVWCVHSPRSGEYWFVRCPSRSGAKIFLCGPLGPKVPTSKGPFEAWEYDPKDIPPGVPILQARFYTAIDPRNWAAEHAQPVLEQEKDVGKDPVQQPDAAQDKGGAAAGRAGKYRKKPKA